MGYGQSWQWPRFSLRILLLLPFPLAALFAVLAYQTEGVGYQTVYVHVMVSDETTGQPIWLSGWHASFTCDGLGIKPETDIQYGTYILTFVLRIPFDYKGRVAANPVFTYHPVGMRVTADGYEDLVAVLSEDKTSSGKGFVTSDMMGEPTPSQAVKVKLKRSMKPLP